MAIYCRKCGAEIQSGLRVCLNCGEEVDLTRQQVTDEFSDGVVQEGYYDSDAARMDEYENRQEIQQDVRKHMAGTVLITLLVALAVIAIALAVMASNKTGIFAEKDPDNLFAAQGNENQVIATVDTPQQDEVPIIDDQPEEQPAEEAAAQPEEPAEQAPSQADEIRNLMITKKWTTTLEGYEGEVEFKKDGRAVITAVVPVLGFKVKKSLDAKYILTDDCEFTISAEYGGKSYGVTGTVEKISDSELKLTRAKNGGTITLKAA